MKYSYSRMLMMPFSLSLLVSSHAMEGSSCPSQDDFPTKKPSRTTPFYSFKPSSSSPAVTGETSSRASKQVQTSDFRNSNIRDSADVESEDILDWLAPAHSVQGGGLSGKKDQGFVATSRKVISRRAQVDSDLSEDDSLKQSMESSLGDSYLSENSRILSLGWINLRSGLPSFDNYDLRTKQYYDAATRFPALQPRVLKNKQDENHARWLWKAKETVSLYHKKRKLKKEHHLPYKKACQVVMAEFGDTRVSIDLLLKIDGLYLVALANQKEKAETFERASRAAKASLQKKNISLEEALKVRELLNDPVHSSPLRTTLNYLLKARTALHNRETYYQKLSIFYENIKLLQTEMEKLPKPPSNDSDAKPLKNESMEVVHQVEVRGTPSYDTLVEQYTAVLENYLKLQGQSPSDHKRLSSGIAALSASQQETRTALDELMVSNVALQRATQEQIPLESLDDYYASKKREADDALSSHNISLDVALEFMEIYLSTAQDNVAQKELVEAAFTARKQLVEATNALSSPEGFESELRLAKMPFTRETLEKTLDLLATPDKQFHARLEEVSKTKSPASKAHQEFRGIERVLRVRHAQKGTVTKRTSSSIYISVGKDQKEIILTPKELRERSLRRENKEEYNAIKVGDSVLLQLTSKELKNHMYNLGRELGQNLTPNYYHLPEQLVGVHRVLGFTVEDSMDLSIQACMLQQWLLEHLRRESKIFQRIITLYWGEYLEKVSGWFNFKAWQNYFGGNPFLELQLKKLTTRYTPKTVIVGRNPKPTTREEVVRNKFKAYQRSNRGKLQLELLDESAISLDFEEQDQREVNQRFQKLENVNMLKIPFQRLYQGLDHGREITTATGQSKTSRWVGAQRITAVRYFSQPLPTTFFAPTRRLFIKSGKVSEDNDVPLFQFDPGPRVKMVEEFPRYEVVKPHRKLWIDVMEALKRRQGKLKPILIAPKGQDQRKLLRDLIMQYQNRVEHQTGQLKKMEDPTWFESIRKKFSGIRKPLEFFFISDPETPLIRSQPSINLSRLGIRDEHFGLRDIFPTAVPGEFADAPILKEFSAINLSFNNLVSPPISFFKMHLHESLVELDVSDNQLTTLDWMPGLRGLVVANVSNNPKIKTLEAFGVLGEDANPNLGVFNLANTGITDLSNIGGFLKLRILDISSNNIGANKKATPVLQPLHSLPLEVLVARDCHFSGSWTDVFPTLSCLQELSIVGNGNMSSILFLCKPGEVDYETYQSIFPKLNMLRISDSVTLKAEVEGQGQTLEALTN